jgi:hypothetical protein
VCTMKEAFVRVLTLSIFAAWSVTYSRAAFPPIPPLELHFECAPEYFLQWISGSAEYKGIEAMVDPTRGIYRLAMFSKDLNHTTYYTNRKEVADKLAADHEEVYFTDIDVTSSPQAGAAAVYEFRFHERKGRSVDWRFNVDQHSVDSLPGLPMLATSRAIRTIDCERNAIAAADSVVVIAGRSYPIDVWEEGSAEPLFTAHQGVYCSDSRLVEVGLGQGGWSTVASPSSIRPGASWVLRDGFARVRTLAITRVSTRSMVVEQKSADPSEQTTMMFDCVGAHYSLRSIESDTPRRAGGLMSWAASKAVGPLVEASRVARLI